MVDVIDEEAEEDILRLAGVQDSDLAETVFEASRKRLTWLMVNLATACLAAFVISVFDATIQEMVALAILMPIVANLGGNAGTQTMTIAVRALATKELTASNAPRLVSRELAISLLNGVILAIVIGLAAGIWFHNMPLGGVLSLALIMNMVCAGLSGILIPITLDKLKIDPAIASSVFLTTITDVVGFFAFLGLGTMLLL